MYNSFSAYYFEHNAISANGKVLYSSAGASIDIVRDSVLSVFSSNYLGSVALNPNGQYLYLTDPGRYMIPEPAPSGKFSVYDMASTAMEDIDLRPWLPIQPVTSARSDMVAVSPDGQTIYISNWFYLLFVVDAQSRQVKKVLDVSPSMQMCMSIARKP